MFHPLPLSRATLKCRCAPQAQPVEPEKPMSWPSFTTSPGFTTTALKWRYCVSSPSPWEMTT
ncbi:hypothetical protein BHS07_35210 [Myxococcus xanthus]|uniref:Uncharacterized protein n=1 Tax=Myxococcus xanthus TaxID=34 RepID=A0AAE6G6B2_MYXXA|nr:hypothetical protein BHS09_34615 [Myxococcus xanthus]QDE78992.1 hypothetical protein BHS08_34640 [Myxococcus xanthus]QDE86368.1 hypothetical protein BHS07_35210 [Myxococcus xanthus]QDF00531.1 hypothetical protein BHS05_34450 [Myxococcus xanthus]QDF08335.1 hypothetical protein BHS04_34740 [Myxococcus xanthus]